MQTLSAIRGAQCTYRLCFQLNIFGEKANSNACFNSGCPSMWRSESFETINHFEKQIVLLFQRFISSITSKNTVKLVKQSDL